jgi:heme exporter protein C
MGMTDTMVFVMLYSIVAFSVVFVDLYWHRIRLGQYAEKIEQLKLRINQ